MSELLFLIAPLAMITVTPVGDNCMTKVFRSLLWFTIWMVSSWRFYVGATLIMLWYVWLFIFYYCLSVHLVLVLSSGGSHTCFDAFYEFFKPIEMLYPQSGKRNINRPSFMSPRPKPCAKDVKQSGHSIQRFKPTQPASHYKDLAAKSKAKEKTKDLNSKRDKRLPDILEEQSGMAENVDLFLREFTMVQSLYKIIMLSENLEAVANGIIMFIQGHSNKSIYTRFSNLFVKDTFPSNYDVCGFVDGLFEQSGSTENEWIADMRAIFSDWKRYRNSKNVHNFLQLINYVVSVGLCDKANLTFSVNGLKLFAPVVTKKQLLATDLFDLIAETSLGFFEGGWRVYTTKKVSAFFQDEDTFGEFETMFHDIKAIHGFSLTGNLRKHCEIDENEYELKLDAAIVLGTKLLKKFGSSVTFERKFVSDRLERIHDYRNEFVQVRTRGGLRVAPFGVSLYGDSAVGKSTLNQLTYEAIGKYNSIDVSPDRVATWADNDKFASNIRASTNVIVFDDFGNTAPKFMDFSPCYRLIQCVNNTLFTAPMAEVNLKGKVGLHPWIVMITTNVEHLLAGVYSEKPESILRRFRHVKVEIKPEFLTSGKLDETKVYNTFGYTKIPDIWKLSVRECQVGSLLSTGSDKRDFALVPIVFEGKPLVDIDVHAYLRWVQITSKKYYAQQRELVETMRKDTEELCPKCGLFGCTCSEASVKFYVDHSKAKEIDETSELDYNDDSSEDESMPGLVVDDGGILDEHSSLIVGPFRLIWRVILAITYYLLSFWYSQFFYFLGVGLRYCRDTGATPNINLYAHMANQSVMHHIIFLHRLYLRCVDMVRQLYADYATEALLNAQHFYNTHWVFDFVVYLPDSYVNSYVYIFATMYQRRFSILERQRMLIGAVVLTYINAITHVYLGSWFRALAVFMLANLFIAVVVACERLMIERELLRRRSVVPAYVQWMRNHYLLTLSGILITAYTCLRMWKESRKLFTHGSLIPANMEEVAARDQETNPWAELVISPLPLTTASKTTRCDDLVKVCEKNTVLVESDRYRTRGFILTSNVLVVPLHYVNLHAVDGKQVDISVKCFRSHRDKVGPNFREVLAKDYCYHIPKTDFVVFYSPSSGSSANVTKFLPTDTPSSSDARFIHKDIDGENVIAPILFEAQTVKHKSLTFQGGKYKLPFVSFSGLCMSPIVSNGHGSCILGFHLCGKDYVGGAGFITQAQADLAIGYLDSIEGCIVANGTGDFPDEQYGHQVITSHDIHRKSAARFITPGNSIEVYGSTTGAASPASNVVDTLISPAVTKVMNVPQQWGPPKMFGKGIYPYQAALETLAHPSLSLGSFIRPAVVCYRSVFPQIKLRLPDLFKEAKPLSDVETVSGIDGRRFIDAMNMKTSPGWPFTGRKDKWIVDLDPADYPHISRPRTFVDKIWNEVDRCCNIMRRGERPYFIWKACLKDEPTKLTKTKVRVFQSAPIALQLLIRKYFLPVVRIIQMNPLESECLVGANAEGPEWEQLNNFMVSKGPNILAGDYSKYDQRMPAQLVIAAFDVLIWIARELCDYPHDAIVIMRGIVGEVAFPLMSYNGDLIQLFGSNPSGQNLTVIINSIANVILMRSCYYSIYPQDAAECLFRMYVAVATYGDDVKGSVDEARSGFNHLSYAHFLSEFDIVFTMPDKESIATRFMNAEEADFLKRINRYNEDLEANVGVLSEQSIFKRLHCHLLSRDLSLEMQSAVNIDSSLHDWFYYGRETFEFRKAQLLKVAHEANILHLCRGFDITYDQRVLRWKLKYRGINNLETSSLSSGSPMDYGVELEALGDIPDEFYVCDFDKELGRL